MVTLAVLLYYQHIILNLAFEEVNYFILFCRLNDSFLIVQNLWHLIGWHCLCRAQDEVHSCTRSCLHQKSFSGHREVGLNRLGGKWTNPSNLVEATSSHSCRTAWQLLLILSPCSLALILQAVLRFRDQVRLYYPAPGFHHGELFIWGIFSSKNVFLFISHSFAS